jgi:hypothetical protein
MGLEIKGKIVKVLPLLSGVSASGKNWEKQDFVIEEVESTYPKTICITGFGDIVNKVKNLQVNQIITAHINIESREYNEKWYTNVGVWKIDFEGVTNTVNQTNNEYRNDAPPKKEEEPELPF